LNTVKKLADLDHPDIVHAEELKAIQEQIEGVTGEMMEDDIMPSQDEAKPENVVKALVTSSTWRAHVDKGRTELIEPFLIAMLDDKVMNAIRDGTITAGDLVALADSSSEEKVTSADEGLVKTKRQARVDDADEEDEIVDDENLGQDAEGSEREGTQTSDDRTPSGDTTVRPPTEGEDVTASGDTTVRQRTEETGTRSHNREG